MPAERYLNKKHIKQNANSKSATEAPRLFTLAHNFQPELHSKTDYLVCKCRSCQSLAINMRTFCLKRCQL